MNLKIMLNKEDLVRSN